MSELDLSQEYSNKSLKELIDLEEILWSKLRLITDAMEVHKPKNENRENQIDLINKWKEKYGKNGELEVLEFLKWKFEMATSIHFLGITEDQKPVYMTFRFSELLEMLPNPDFKRRKKDEFLTTINNLRNLKFISFHEIQNCPNDSLMLKVDIKLYQQSFKEISEGNRL